MIKNYNKFNESINLKYPYRKVYFEINSKDDIITIYDYLDSILWFNIKRPISQPEVFPNFIGIPTDIYSLQVFKIPAFSYDMVTKDRIDRFIKNYGYDPVILKMNDLKLLKSIIFKGEKIKTPVYNEPRKLVYEGIKHLLNFKLFEQKEELSTYKLKKRWDKKRSAIKELQHNIIKLRNKVFKDMDSDDEKTMIVATIVRIIDKTGERVGNENSKDIGHYGISHLMKKHITLNKDEVTLSYVGKSGVKHKVTFTDYKVARNIKKLKLNKYSEVFTTSHGLSIKSTQVNKYLVDFNITSKDLRGFKVNKLMSEKLRRTKKPNTDGELKRVFNDILREVAEEIGHTPGICRKNYLLPEIEKEWYDRKKVQKI